MKECLGYFLIYVAIAGGAIFLLGYDLTWLKKTWNFSWTYSIRRINHHRCVSYIGGRCINGVHI